MECHENAKLGEGNFSWKENGNQRNALDENSKRFAMETTLSGGYDTSELDAGISEWGGKVTSLTEQIHALEQENNDLLAQISKASVEDAAELRRQARRVWKMPQSCAASIMQIGLKSVSCRVS